MLKEGSTFVDEPVLKNIEACKQLAQITSTSMGPYGLCKMVINHLGKLFVTHDAATILTELEVEHPAAKMMVMASKAMQEEIGDGTNFVIALAGELLAQAETLLRLGLHTSDIITGYTRASAKALELLDETTAGRVDDPLVLEKVVPLIRTAISSKQYGMEIFLADLVARACINACPSNPKHFNVDNVRVTKLDGDSSLASTLIRGFVITRGAEGTIKHVKDAKVALYGCAIDIPATETKGNVLIENAQQLMNYSKNEEELMERVVKDISTSGAKVVVSNSNYGDLALHYLERYGIMAIKVSSKFEMHRLSQAVGARVMARMDPPTLEELGHCDHVDVEQLGGKSVVIFSQDKDDSRLSTIIVRGATQNAMDDVERAIDDGVNVFKAIAKDGRYVAGGGAFEMEMQKRLMSFAEVTPGLDQYALRKYASSFEVVARTLAEVSGFNGTDAVTKLEAEHHSGHQNAGVNVEDGNPMDVLAAGIVDPYLVKHWGVKLASDVVVTVLTVDQIIVAKQAGGPKVRPDQARDEDD